VGVSKKSLDDYLLQLRFGKKYGFDFQKHRNDKVGVLRCYVKEQKSKSQKATGGKTKDSSLPKKWRCSWRIFANHSMNGNLYLSLKTNFVLKFQSLFSTFYIHPKQSS